MPFNFTAVVQGYHKPWHEADPLSNNSLGEPQLAKMLVERDEDNKPELSMLEFRTISNESRQESVRLQNLCKHAEQGYDHQALKEVPRSQKALPELFKQYSQVCHNLALDENLWVPPADTNRDNSEILSQLLEAHQVAVCTNQQAQLIILARFGE